MSNKVSTLWSAASGPLDSGEAGAPSEPLPSARILVVDDVPANLVALRAVLEPLGQEIVEATSGPEALRQLLHQEFAVILMDVQMPGLDGLETARLIKSRERSRHIPILFITALSREMAYIARGYAEGGVDYLLKPVDPEILRSKVAVFVELFLKREEVKRQAVELAERRRSELEMQQANEVAQQLVGIVSHDIRSPLAALLATAQARLKAGGSSEADTRAFERVRRSGERIEQVVSLLLDFTRARIGGGIPLVHRPGTLEALCRNAVEEMQAAQPDRVIECVFPEAPLKGEWDLDRLAQVLANLLDNALKYGQVDRPVRLTSKPLGDSAVVLEVQNHGAPIPKDQLPTLFQPFHRGERSAESTRSSLGLGLFIVAEIVRAHGGSLHVSSTAEEGTTFRLCLPRHPASASTASPCAAHELSLSA